MVLSYSVRGLRNIEGMLSLKSLSDDVGKVCKTKMTDEDCFVRHLCCL